jgi:hypothetical protein
LPSRPCRTSAITTAGRHRRRPWFGRRPPDSVVADRTP